MFGAFLLPDLAVFHFRIWLYFTSGFGNILLPDLAFKLLIKFYPNLHTLFTFKTTMKYLLTIIQQFSITQKKDPIFRDPFLL